MLGIGAAAILSGCTSGLETAVSNTAQSVSKKGALMTYPHSCMNGAFLDWGGLTEEYEETKLLVSLANEYEKPRLQRWLKEIEDKMAAKFGGGLEVSDQLKREFNIVKQVYGDRASLVKTITFKDLVEAIESAGQANNGLSHLFIGGHGEPKSIKLGLDTYFSLSDVDKPEFVRLKKYIKGPVCLSSCSTGAPQSDGECMAQSISRVWNAEVHAPITPLASGFTPSLRMYGYKSKDTFIKDAVYFEDFIFLDRTYDVEHTPDKSNSFRFKVRLSPQGKVESIDNSDSTSMTPKQKESAVYVRENIDKCDEPFYKEMVQAKKGRFILSPNLIAMYKNGERLK